MSWLGGGGGGGNTQAQTDALNKQLAIMQEQLDEQKKQDAAALQLAQQNAADQKAAYEKQMDLANKAFDQQKLEAAAALKSSQDQAAAAAASASAQLDASNKSMELQVEAINRANQKAPDVGAIVKQNIDSARSGVSSTMLTGPSGVDVSALMLGKNTLLGS